MSLKFFHVFFITLSSLMCLGVGVWAVDAWRSDGASNWVVLAAVAFAAAGGLVAYGNSFLKKARRLGIAGLLVAGVLGLPGDALACPACVGTTDSALQTGMNNGVFALLGVIGFMLACFAYFFVYLAVRARRVRPENETGFGFEPGVAKLTPVS